MVAVMSTSLARSITAVKAARPMAAVAPFFLSRAAVVFQHLFMAVEDLFELCLAKRRTSSQSVQH